MPLWTQMNGMIMDSENTGMNCRNRACGNRAYDPCMTCAHEASCDLAIVGKPNALKANESAHMPSPWDKPNMIQGLCLYQIRSVRFWNYIYIWVCVFLPCQFFSLRGRWGLGEPYPRIIPRAIPPRVMPLKKHKKRTCKKCGICM